MLERFDAAFQFRFGIVHFLLILFRTRQNNFITAPSVENEARVLVTLRSFMLNDSMAL